MDSSLIWIEALKVGESGQPAPKEHMGVQVDAIAEQTKFDSRGEVDGAVTALGMGSEEE